MSLPVFTKEAVQDKTVLVRADLNVPINKQGKVSDSYRITQLKPTIQALQTANAKIIICAHLGRPNGEINPKYSLTQIVSKLSDVLETDVKLLSNYSKSACTEIWQDSPKTIVLLENTRFHPGEKKNDPEFAKQLAELADVYINDAFGAAHRAHASTVGVSQYLPSYAGMLLELETNALSEALTSPPDPLIVITGGAKINTKIGMLKTFAKSADHILIGGALANTFLQASGYDIGDSLAEPDKNELAQEIMATADQHNTTILIPLDVIAADEISADAQTVDLPREDIIGQMKILDIGSQTQTTYQAIIQDAGTIIWNGPMGLYEFPPFASGTKNIAEAIANSPAKTYIGGGDSIDACNQFGISLSRFTHASTGGAAMIEFLEGKELPALKALQT